MATIHIFRTAEAEYNAEPGFWTMRDSGLSVEGLEQCIEFSAYSEFLSSMQYVTHVVSSPLRSSIFSCRIAFDRVVSSTSVIVSPNLMDVGCPTPSLGTDAVTLGVEFSGQIDRSMLPNGWESIDSGSANEYKLENIKARTKAAREWLMDLARTAGEKAHIVVMTHGQTAHLVADDFQGVESPYDANWDGDLSWRSYNFDFAAEKMIETTESRVRRGVADTDVLTDDENSAIRAAVEGLIEERAPLIRITQADHVEAENALPLMVNHLHPN
ncbi:uncharacterized protein GGS22DRAFT_195853 [Annulohypoxylon maeteangense]|uniref:uncharacterized protein n=1 Tax=Annulohypoxylon maeteangense TaxID=1927788 RepID=UPI002008B7E3|nr:uncharacterized protein GGS22DRAFT_195853 [Annulohypoxylon maeteangense]KAI0882627.1 hypothetical protein GGS22DRAFT_195853 [Annulohypoxylon maeteangense]